MLEHGGKHDVNFQQPADKYSKTRVKEMLIIYGVFQRKEKMTQKRKQQKQVSKNSHKQTGNVLHV